jgi:hypothetical protein
LGGPLSQTAAPAITASGAAVSRRVASTWPPMIAIAAQTTAWTPFHRVTPQLVESQPSVRSTATI